MKSDPFDIGGLGSLNDIFAGLFTCWYCKRAIEKDDITVRTRRGRIHSICHTKGLVALAQKKAEAK